MKTQFTRYQKEEIIPLIEIRQDTIAEDADSADEFETEESLNRLMQKIQCGDMNFTEAEKKWLIREFNTRVSIANGNKGHEPLMVLNSYINSMHNAIDKVNDI